VALAAIGMGAWGARWLRVDHGVEPTRLLQNAAVSLGSWSPDGRWLAFDATIGDRTDIHVVPSSGGAVRRLTEGPAHEIDPEWSRDGRWIYFSSDQSGRSAIWRMPAGGGAAAQLTAEVGFEPRESPDGRWVYFIDHARFGLGPVTKLRRIPAGGGPMEVLDVPVMPGAWEVTDSGIAFVFTAGRADVDDATPGPALVQVYDFAEHGIRSRGELAFVVGPYGSTHFFTASRDGRWALASHVDRWDRDILVVDNFR
jgi:hypothetical protein